MSENNKRESIGAFWNNTDRRGDKYLGGAILDRKVHIRKEGEFFKIVAPDEEWAEVGVVEPKGSGDKARFVGTYDGQNVVILKNRFKKEDKHPDWRVFEDEKPPPRQSGGWPDDGAPSNGESEDIPF